MPRPIAKTAPSSRPATRRIVAFDRRARTCGGTCAHGARVGGRRSVLHVLAGRAGVTTPEAACRRFGGRHHRFISRRFDRSAGDRIHFASAMGWRDGDEGASYLGLAEALMREGAHAARDLEQL